MSVPGKFSVLIVALGYVIHIASAAITLPQSAFGTPRNATFDYVVVGGGTAGLAVAARLAEASQSVAVIEAGGFYEEDAGNFTTVPAYAVIGAGTSPNDELPGVDWGFVTTPQPGMGNRSIHYSRGKTLGGSSARNYFTYNRPTVGALNKWASDVGDDSYKYDNFLPYFKKSVDYTPPDNNVRPKNASVPSPADAFTPGAGPLRVSFATWANPFSSFAYLAFKKLGFSPADGFVSGKLSGVQYCMNTINPEGQIRDTSYSSFLESVAGKDNIRVFNNTLAKQILFNDKTATSVLVSSDGVEYFLGAKKEIVLSAGAFQSPQLLMVSGIGPADLLKKFGITPISQLNGVGQNMQDHVLFGTTYQVNTLTHSAVTNDPAYGDLAKDEYNTNGTGMLSNAGGEILAWEKLNCGRTSNCSSISASTREILSSLPSDWPTYEYLIADAYSGNNEDYQTGAPKDKNMYASPGAGVMLPQSRGTVSISSADMVDPPIINPNWLTHKADQELAILGFRRIRQLMDTEIMKGVSITEVLPGRDVDTDEGILKAIQTTGIQMFHASATCKMGKSSDESAVVDSHARVFGTKNLRVVDISAIPFLPPGHPQAMVYALAEKISDDILQS